MSRTIGDLRPSEPAPEEAALGEYLLAYSALESSLRRLVGLAVATTHGYSGDRYLRTRLMVDALTNEMTFHGVEEAIAAIIEIRAQALDDESRGELQSEWTTLRGSCDNERGFRNRLAHRSVTTPEELGGAIHVAGKTPETYSAEKLRERAARVYRLRDRVADLATQLSYEVRFE